MNWRVWLFLSFAFAMAAMFCFGLIWFGNLFYYENGTPPPTEATLNEMLFYDTLLVGIPIALSAFFAGKAVGIRKMIGHSK